MIRYTTGSRASNSLRLAARTSCTAAAGKAETGCLEKGVKNRFADNECIFPYRVYLYPPGLSVFLSLFLSFIGSVFFVFPLSICLYRYLCIFLLLNSFFLSRVYLSSPLSISLSVYAILSLSENLNLPPLPRIVSYLRSWACDVDDLIDPITRTWSR